MLPVLETKLSCRWSFSSSPASSGVATGDHGGPQFLWACSFLLIQNALLPRTTLIKDNSLLCIGDVIRALLPISSAVPVLLKVLQLSVTFGVGSAGCEWSFSSLARIKTKLRSTMGEGRLTNVAVLSIERELSGALDINAVIDRFRSRTEIAFN